MSAAPAYVRFRSTAANARGVQVGVFALANGLAHDDRLDAAQRRWWRAANDWYDAAYAAPCADEDGPYDRDRHPGAVAWFKADASHLLERVDGYLALLDAHGVPWERAVSDDPGRIVYEDDVQVVAVPRATGEAPR